MCYQKIGAGVGQRIFTGHEYDGATSLSYMDARYYNGNNGKFISEDPMFLSVGFDLSDPQSMNAYAYARNNPLRYNDPNGKWFEEALSWVNARTGIGQAVDSSPAYNYAVEHPVQGGIAVGLGSGAILAAPELASYGSDLLSSPGAAPLIRSAGIGTAGGLIGQGASDALNSISQGKVTISSPLEYEKVL